MKKITFLLITIIYFQCYSQSQDEVIFKIQYSPETIYYQTIKQTSKSETKYIGSEDFLKKLSDNGIRNPTVTDKQSTIETVFKTGKRNNKMSFPLTIEFAKTTNSDGKKIVPDGTLIYGHGTSGSMPSLDSIVSTGLDESLKKTLLQTMQSTFAQLSFPERKVKVGETFSRNSPLSIPIGKSNIDMTITTTYKLLNIEKGIANFDVKSVYTVNSTVAEHNIIASGSSVGSMLLDTVNKNFVRYETDTEINMHMKLEGFDLDINSKSGFIQTTVVAKN